MDISPCIVCYGSGRMRCDACMGRGEGEPSGYPPPQPTIAPQQLKIGLIVAAALFGLPGLTFILGFLFF